MAIWNPWHGCHKISAGCLNCYVYRRDQSIGKDANIVTRTSDYDLPIRRDRNKVFKLQPSSGEVYTCMTSDFFLEDADEWRGECWRMMKKRQDLQFVIITKRIHRFAECIPDDWGEGYPNVTICCTCENQDRVDYRLPIFLSQPIRHRNLIHEPMLGPVQIGQYLATGKIDKVICGGESGSHARVCRYDWILSVRQECMENKVPFHFKQTGAVFEKDGKVYHVERKYQQSQASKAGIDYFPEPLSANLSDWLSRDLFQRISESRFRSRFRLKEQDRAYVLEKGMERIRSHAKEIVQSRLAPQEIPNDGHQTPMRGHPVFLAQHACGCCCRSCLFKWHGIPQGRELTEQEQSYIVDVLAEWISRQMPDQPAGFLDSNA